MIELKNVTKKYPNAIALDHLTLTLAPRQTHVIIGSSGSGKSTLLRAFLGLIECDDGEVFYDGVAVSSMSAETKSVRFGYMPQEGGLFPHLSAKDNVALVARARGWQEPKVLQRIDELLPLVSLDPEVLKRFPHQMSGGQRQRVGLLRAAFLDPNVLIMDEPLGALDPLIRADLQVELKETFKRFGKTVIFVTHDMIEAAYLGDQIILLNKGRIEQSGSFKDLRDRPASDFVSRFLRAQNLRDESTSL